MFTLPSPGWLFCGLSVNVTLYPKNHWLCSRSLMGTASMFWNIGINVRCDGVITESAISGWAQNTFQYAFVVLLTLSSSALPGSLPDPAARKLPSGVYTARTCAEYTESCC